MSKTLYISTFPLGVLKILKNLRVFCYKYNVHPRYKKSNSEKTFSAAEKKRMCYI